jgi:hypothetical protein
MSFLLSLYHSRIFFLTIFISINSINGIAVLNILRAYFVLEWNDYYAIFLVLYKRLSFNHRKIDIKLKLS